MTPEVVVMVVVLRRHFIVGSGALALAGWAGSAGAEGALAALLGNYRNVGGEKDRAARDKAIDDVVKEMSPISRGIARDKLTETSPIAAKVTISSDPKLVTIAQDQRSYAAPLDGKSVKVKGINGDELNLKCVVGAVAMEQIFWLEDRGRTNTYRVNGKKLAMHVRVHSTKLPKDVLYTLSYERV